MDRKHYIEIGRVLQYSISDSIPAEHQILGLRWMMCADEQQQMQRKRKSQGISLSMTRYSWTFLSLWSASLR